MPHLMSLSLTPSVLVPTIALVASVLIAHTGGSPIQLQRRPSFFRCNGWGAGCSNWDYVFKPVPYSSRSETRSTVTRTVAPKPTVVTPAPPSADRLKTRHNYGLHFLFTSGQSWGANGKRQDPALRRNRPLTVQELYDILNGMLV